MSTPPDQAAQKLDELLNKVYIAGYQAGKQSGLTMVIAGDVILPEARNEVLALRLSRCRKIERYENS